MRDLGSRYPVLNAMIVDSMRPVVLLRHKRMPVRLVYVPGVVVVVEEERHQRMNAVLLAVDAVDDVKADDGGDVSGLSVVVVVEAKRKRTQRNVTRAVR